MRQTSFLVVFVCQYVDFLNGHPFTEDIAGTMALCRSLSPGLAPLVPRASSLVLGAPLHEDQHLGASHSISSPQLLFWVMLFIFGPLEISMTLLQDQRSV